LLLLIAKAGGGGGTGASPAAVGRKGRRPGHAHGEVVCLVALPEPDPLRVEDDQLVLPENTLMGQTVPANVSGDRPFPPRGGNLGRQDGVGPGPLDVHPEHLGVVEQEGGIDVVGVQKFGVAIVVMNTVQSNVVFVMS